MRREKRYLFKVGDLSSTRRRGRKLAALTRWQEPASDSPWHLPPHSPSVLGWVFWGVEGRFLLYGGRRKGDPKACPGAGLLLLPPLIPSQQERSTAVSSTTPRTGHSIPFTAQQQGASARASSCLRQQKMEDRKISPISLDLLENSHTFQRHSWLSQLCYRPSPASQFQQGVLLSSNMTRLLTGTQPSFLPSQIKLWILLQGF